MVGKTAMAYHIAYLTKRDVFQVDISKIRDKYVGESEKRVKAIFEEYKRESAIYEQKPILLFNEADALIGSRVNIEQSVDQMNNSMQNILLEELENFDGILIATTNLLDNLDDAFSRRFLYKINFPKPDLSTREKIWKSKIEDIDSETIKKLSQLELSGGQIDNIAKKHTLDAVLHKSKDYHTTLLKYAQEEEGFKYDNESSKIGFA